MKLLSHIMSLTESWSYCWWLNDEYSRIINHADRLGIVCRLSVTQVHWTEKGSMLFKKYLLTPHRRERRSYENKE